MAFPPVDAAAWRAQVDKELARTPGASFDKSLLQTTPEGIVVQPLYTDDVGSSARAITRAPGAGAVRIVSRLAADASLADLDAEIDGGADGVWISGKGPALDAFLRKAPAERPLLLVDLDAAELTDGALVASLAGSVMAVDAMHPSRPAPDAAATATLTVPALAELPKGATALVSTLRYHDAGASAADELGIAWAIGRAYLAELLDKGASLEAAAGGISFRVSVGRDTFSELCKLRALRLGWTRLLIAAGLGEGAARGAAPRVHAVSSARALTQRDPWVNMLRVTTQMFAAMTGGADFVTAAPFDAELAAPGALGRRLARNTGLVLREESFLGRVADPANGGYFFEALTFELARRGWTQFQAIERQGGIVESLASGALGEHLAKAWSERAAALSKRALPVLGVSEFAHLEEQLPSAPAPASSRGPSGLPRHRDAETFEALRDAADAHRAGDGAARPVALLVTVGAPAEARGRIGFARQLFAVGGFAAREAAETNETGAGGERLTSTVACLCGTDESYASPTGGAVLAARSLKARGVRRVLLAGRPGQLEEALREAGVDDFVFVGCDAAAVLTAVVAAERQGSTR